MDTHIRPDKLPRHVAVIMDGNGRWAERRGLPRQEGHRAGVEAVRRVVRASHDLGIPWLTLFAFSSENWNRPKDEIDELMRLPEEFFEEELPEAIENGTRILVIGNTDRLPPQTRATLGEAVEKTREGNGMRLVFALSYGARAELVEVARRLLREQEQGRLDPESLDEKTFAAHLDEPDMPDVDLLIRTGAESRVSNFLLWQIAYAEIIFSQKMWPDFDRPHLEEALLEYQSRERRYGRTSAQLTDGT